MAGAEVKTGSQNDVATEAGMDERVVVSRVVNVRMTT